MSELPETQGIEMEASDEITLSQAAALSATLERNIALREGTPLPCLWHWIYFRPCTPQTLLGTDGHPKKSGRLSDLALPRRMWAGGHLRFHAPLKIGCNAKRTTRVASLEQKTGRTGRLAFTTMLHEISDGDTSAIREEQHIVYRDFTAPGATKPAPQRPPEASRWEREINPTEVLLFRYSALTFNSHRIHYDKPYAKEIEGYPDLVVHGPLIATLLMELLAINLPDAAVVQFTYKAVRPIFVGGSFIVCGQPTPDGRTVELWAKDHEGWLAMSACAMLA